ncbi:MAG: methylenetetrahydrofolate reductase, partial [Acidimicrobiia bacterium]|nr:methylenetetrahydrofolate reductase [Acidimicrobiia bacterium]
LVEYRRIGVANILALGGDPPADGRPEAGEYLYASDLLADIASSGTFSIGVAAHPEVHPRSPDRESDRRHLADKLSVADFAISQFFFEVEYWIRLVDELDALGVDKPVVPGVMPIANKAQLYRMATMNGTEIPGWLRERLDATDEPDEVRRIGVEVATNLSGQLLDAGAPGLHIYALNRPEAVQKITADLGLVGAGSR